MGVRGSLCKDLSDIAIASRLSMTSLNFSYPQTVEAISTRRLSSASIAGAARASLGALPIPVVEEAIAHIPYVPELPDELQLDVGDRVLIHERFHDNWALGTCVRTQKTGCFPVLCLDARAASVIASEIASEVSSEIGLVSK
jgi:hypothetical protein